MRSAYLRSGATTIVADPANDPFFAVTSWSCVELPPVSGTLTVSAAGVATFPVDRLGPHVAKPEKSLASNVIVTTT